MRPWLGASASPVATSSGMGRPRRVRRARACKRERGRRESRIPKLAVRDWRRLPPTLRKRVGSAPRKRGLVAPRPGRCRTGLQLRGPEGDRAAGSRRPCARRSGAIRRPVGEGAVHSICSAGPSAAAPGMPSHAIVPLPTQHRALVPQRERADSDGEESAGKRARVLQGGTKRPPR